MKRRRMIKLMAAGALGSACAGTAATGEPSAATAARPATGEQVVWSRKVPVRYEADVAVIGGGMAGVSAACAAAKSGAKVVLVERYAITGGDLTVGGVANFSGETQGQGEVFDAIIADLEKFSAVGPYNNAYPKQGNRLFDQAIMPIVLQELLLRRGVKLLLHTQFVDAQVSDRGHIRQCIVCGKSGPEALRARQFIDCTGEADVARAAGFATVKGRPEDGLQLPMSVHCFVRHVDPKDAGPAIPDGWVTPIKDRSELPMVSPWPNGPNSTSLKIKIPMFDATDTESFTAAEIQARRRALQVFQYYHDTQHRAWRYDGCAPQIGIREGARIVGDYVLNLADLRAGRKFDDAIARGVYYLDGHKPDDDKRTYILPHKDLKVPPYQIPLRSLLVRDGANLLAAGRCLSCDQLALSSARVSPTCSMMGQAAGIAAALCALKQCELRACDPAEVRRIVEQRGAILAV